MMTDLCKRENRESIKTALYHDRMWGSGGKLHYLFDIERNVRRDTIL
jgi:hypothetical protein